MYEEIHHRIYQLAQEIQREYGAPFPFVPYQTLTADLEEHQIIPEGATLADILTALQAGGKIDKKEIPLRDGETASIIVIMQRPMQAKTKDFPKTK